MDACCDFRPVKAAGMPWAAIVLRILLDGARLQARVLRLLDIRLGFGALRLSRGCSENGFFIGLTRA
jgi:hypothetical protein